MSMYTWNWKTGHLDRLARYTGLEIVGSVLAPGKWVHRRAHFFWDSYIHLHQAQEQNVALQKEIQSLKLEIMRLRKEAQTASRLRELLHFSPPPEWEFQGADIIGSRIGPNAVLQTLTINKGRRQGITKNTPILTPDGVVGRTNQVSPHFATVLLITDPNSNIPVRGQRSRTNGILRGQGLRRPLQVKHVPQNSPMYEDEILVTSGLDGLFPKGLPVARVENVTISDLSLFKEVQARSLVDVKRQEEVLAIQWTQTGASSVPKADP
ncbi:MAG: rod shape-determining protein MreC [Desulfovermiculus sp.]